MPEITGSLRPPRLSAPPSSPAQGEVYFNTSDNTLYWHDGSNWVPAMGAGGGGGGQLIGAPIPWLLAAIPAGFLEFNGQAIDSGTYPQLAALFGTNLPDLRGDFLMGRDAGHAVGTVGGESVHTLLPAEMPIHTHVQNAHDHVQDAHDHTPGSHTHTMAHTHTLTHDHTVQTGASVGGGAYVARGTGTVADIGGSGGSPIKYPPQSSGAASNGTTTVPSASNVGSTTANNQTTVATNQNAGGDGAHNNLPPYQAVIWITAAG